MNPGRFETEWLHYYEQNASHYSRAAEESKAGAVRQALDRVGGLREMPELFRLYEECIEVAESKLATDHERELRLVEALTSAASGTGAADALSTPLANAREAIRACQPLEKRVDELRSRSGLR